MSESALIVAIWSLWPTYNTEEIAEILGVDEADVYNLLDEARALKVGVA